MLGREELARIALRHDTTMARAMLTALAWPRPWAFAKRARPRPSPRRPDPYAGAASLMRERVSAMDSFLKRSV